MIYKQIIFSRLCIRLKGT